MIKRILTWPKTPASEQLVKFLAADIQQSDTVINGYEDRSFCTALEDRLAYEQIVLSSLPRLKS